MKKSLARLQNPRSYSDGSDQVRDQSIIIPSKIVTIADSFQKKGNSWFIDSQIPTDLSIQVQEMTFNVHKYQLASKCGYIGRMELQPSISKDGYDLKLESFPGGPETFEMILKYCYSLPVDLNPDNIAPLRCASEFLEMTEELEDGNLISKTEAFLTFVVLSSWKDTITVLKSCETLYPWAENLQIVRRCCGSIAWKASRDNSSTGDIISEYRWWFDDVATLRIDHFTRIMTATRAKLTKPEFIGKCILHYAKKWLPNMEVEVEGLIGCGQGKTNLQISILSGRKEEMMTGQSKEQKYIIESLISILPPQQEAVPCKFLLQMLRMAMVYSASPALISELEKRVGIVLEDADVNDLLIPSYKRSDQGKLVNSLEECTMHDTEVVQRIVEYFFMHEQEQQQKLLKSGKSTISKLIDNYLAEIARDPNLSITKFQLLAKSLPENARTCHDGLYRAIDIYLKTHPLLSEQDRRRLCKIMICEKLSLDACMHAAQNERLPLRTVVQVLFSEQVKMRPAMQVKEQAPTSDNSDQEGNRLSTDRDIKALKVELENIKKHMAEMQADYSELQREYEKITNKQKNLSGWSFGWRKKVKNSLITKFEGDETGEGPKTPNPVGWRVSLRRRQSVS